VGLFCRRRPALGSCRVSARTAFSRNRCCGYPSLQGVIAPAALLMDVALVWPSQLRSGAAARGGRLGRRRWSLAQIRRWSRRYGNQSIIPAWRAGIADSRTSVQGSASNGRADHYRSARRSDSKSNAGHSASITYDDPRAGHDLITAATSQTQLDPIRQATDRSADTRTLRRWERRPGCRAAC
jgi:hypothetical protein